MLKVKRHILYPVLVTFLFCFFYLNFLSHTVFFVSARLKSIDILYSWRSQHAKSLAHLPEIVIIGVDDDSYQKMNRAWPWGRDVFAVFIENLQKLNPKVIGLDFALVGESSNAATDKWLAESISKNKNVILADYFDSRGQYIVPLEIFSEAALGHGFVGKTFDRDSVVRHVKTLVRLQGVAREPVFSFSTLVAYTYLGLSPSQSIEAHEGSIVFSLPAAGDKTSVKKVSVSVDKNGQRLLSFRYKTENFAYFPFWKVITGLVPRQAVEGKIVLVGSISPIFHDIHLSPLGNLAGVYFHANEILTILDQDFIRELFPKYQWLFFITIIMIPAFFYYQSRFLTGLSVLVGTEFLIYATSIYLFQAKNILFEPFSPMFVSMAVYFAMMTYRSLRTLIENVTLQRMVITDSLTGLYAHRYLTLRLATEFEHFREAQAEFCFVMMDIDLFKQVNDKYGHEKGNEVLIRIANLLKSGLRGSDVLARYGGEEFSVIMMKQVEKIAYMVMDRIRHSIENEVFAGPDGNFKGTISSGICSNLDPDVLSAEDMIRLADNALYQAKSAGRNCIRIYQSKKRPPPDPQPAVNPTPRVS